MNKANECTCPSGDGSLVHPCPAHPAVEQVGGDERAGLRAAAKWHREQRNAFEAEAEMHRQRYENTNRPDSLTAEAEHHRRLWETASAMAANHLDYAAGFEEMARAALAQPSPVRSSLLINGYQLRAALDFIAPDGTAEQLESEACIEWRQQDADFLEAGLYAFCAEYPEEGGVLLDEEPTTAQPSRVQAEQHWPKLEKPAQVGAIRFHAGLSSRLVVEAAQRLYEFESTPEKEAERIERLQAFREQLDPLNLAQHAKAFNEAPAEALKPGQAEEERPKIVATLFTPNEKVHDDIGFKAFAVAGDCDKDGGEFYDPEKLMTVAQHERIVGAEKGKTAAAMLESHRQFVRQFEEGTAELIAQRDAALARVAELAQALRHLLHNIKASGKRIDLGLAKECAEDALARIDSTVAAQAQHSVPEGWMLVECGIWTQEQVDEMQKTVARFRNSEFVDDRALAMAVADAGQCKAPEISLAELLAAAPGKEVGHE
ncbi:TPA: hypothetical protein NKO46_003534 [Pseudomonas aeruginosa]|nr:hypothetical protein [Pseudomonas aeruginosa]